MYWLCVYVQGWGSACCPCSVVWSWGCLIRERSASSRGRREKVCCHGDVEDGGGRTLTFHPSRGEDQCVGHQGLPTAAVDDLHCLCGLLRCNLPLHWPGCVSCPIPIPPCLHSSLLQCLLYLCRIFLVDKYGFSIAQANVVNRYGL